MRYRFAVLSRIVVFAGITGLSLSCAAPSEAAQEQRCQELGVICLCSFTFDVSGWQTGSPNWSAQATTATIDESDKPCWNQGGRHAVQMNEGAHLLKQFSSGGLNNLPFTRSGSTGCCLAVPMGGASYSLVPNYPYPTGMIGARYYFRMSEAYNSTGQGGCTNDKTIQIGGPYLNPVASIPHFADNGGPAGLVPSGGKWGAHVNTVNSVKGKWVRAEMYNNFNTNLKRFYIVNVTDGIEESWANTLPTNSGSPCCYNIVHRFKEPAGGVCSGTLDVMYAIAVRWPNPVGNERIGPAIELEGGQTSSPNSPPAPTGLTILP
jgi:hypothetical protein